MTDRAFSWRDDSSNIARARRSILVWSPSVMSLGFRPRSFVVGNRMPSHQGALTSPLGEVHAAPYVAARISWAGQFRDLPGLIDSGADQSTIPKITAQALGLQKISDVTIEDANGRLEDQDVFVIDLEFHGRAVRSLPVAATNFPVVLIGRDVLSELVVELDGPGVVFKLRW